MKRLCLCLIGCHLLLSAFSQDKSILSIPQLLQKAKNEKTDTARLRWQLQAADAYVLKPGEDKVDLDSALLLTDQVRQANVRLRDPRIQALAYLVCSRAWRERNRPDSGKKYIHLAEEGFSQLPDSLNLGYAYLEFAHYYNVEDPAQEEMKISLYRKAAKLFERAGEKEIQASTLESLGDCLFTGATCDYVASVQVLLQALKIYTAIGHTYLSNLYTLLGRNYSSMGDAPNALKYALLAVRQEEDLSKPDRRLCTAYNTLGFIYFNFEDYQNAEAVFQKALAAAIQFKDTAAITTSAINLVNAELKQGLYRKGLAGLRKYTKQYPFQNSAQPLAAGSVYIVSYSELGYLDSARPYVEKFMRISDSLPINQYYHLYVDPAIIRYLLKSKQYELARKYATRFEAYCSGNHERPRLYPIYYQLFQADSAIGDFKTAVVDYQKYIHLKDSLLQVANGRQMATLRLDYETEKKDKDIAVLTREQALAHAALHQADLTRNAVIAGSALLLILLVVSYNRYRTKRRSNFLLQLQAEAIDQKNLELHQLNLSQTKLLNEKEWLLREIHHRVKNNLQMAMSLLNIQSFHLENEKALSAIRQSGNRMYAMSLIHQRLYQADNLELIEMNRYIPELIEFIRDGYTGNVPVYFQTQVDQIRLDVADAVPVGLIVNEAVTNAIKHAFPGRQSGMIRVTLKWLPDDQILLEISDDGVGLADVSDLQSKRSMGMQLIDGFNEQLEGELTIKSEGGLVISISFPHLAERPGKFAIHLAENQETIDI
jgi:two-component system, sensor histidine kinase PdtaS